MVEFRHHVAEERRCHISTMQQPSPPAYGQPSPHPLPASLKKKYPKFQTAFLLFFNKLYSILQIGFFFVLNCKIGMPYIYIHRYTINYNKGTGACLYQVTTGLQLK